MKHDWATLRKNIPSKIKTKAKITFDVLWQDNLVDKGGKSCHGITEFNPPQIKLDTKQSDKECVLTFFHEALHAFSDGYDGKMTESQVTKMERIFPYLRELFLALEGKK